MRPKLSICIPTYNRAVFLRECLESVIAAAGEDRTSVEILVSDNCSTDETPAILEQFSKRCGAIRVLRNQENIGGDRNILSVAASGRGEYIWVLGDDDRLVQGAVRQVLEVLASSPDILVCNFSTHTKFFERTVCGRYFGPERMTVYNRRDDVLKNFGISLGFVSAVILRSDAFLAVRPEAYEKYVEYGWPFLKIVYSSMREDSRTMYIPEIVVQNRLGNSDISDWVKTFVKGSALLLEELRSEGYSAKSVSAAKEMVIRDYVLNYMLNSKADGRQLSLLYPVLDAHYSATWRYRLQCVPLRLVPSVLLAVMKFSWRRVRGRI